VSVGFFIIYLLTLSHNLVASHDSVGYINEIDSGKWLFHPHHLLYHPISLLWLRLLRAIGITADSALIVSSLNAVFGSASAGLVFFFLRSRFGDSKKEAMSTVLLIGCSFGFWFYSVCVEVYIIPLFFLLAALFILVKTPLRIKDLFWVGVIHGIGILFFQAHVLFTFAVFARIFFTKETEFSSKWKALFTYLIPASGIAIIGYLLVILFDVQAHTLDAALYWLSSYAHDMAQCWNVPSFHSLVKAVIGFSHSFIGGHFLFGIPGFEARFTKALGDQHEFHDEAFLVHTASPMLSILLLILTICLVGCILFIFIKSIPSIKKIYVAQRSQILPILVFLLVYCIFFFVWDPSNLEFWIPQSVLCWLLFDRILAYRRLARSTKIFRIALPLLLVTINFFGSILYLHHESDDYFYVLSTAAAKETSANDIIITDQPWIEEEYYKRFTKTSVFTPQEVERSDSKKKIFAAGVHSTLISGGKIWLSFPIESMSFSFKPLWEQSIASIPLQQTQKVVADKNFIVISKK